MTDAQTLYEVWRAAMIRNGIRMVPFWDTLTEAEQRAWAVTYAWASAEPA